MFQILLNCKNEEILYNAEQLFLFIKSKEEAEQFIRVLWKRVPELTEQQEKEIHKIGRKIRKKFKMKPIKI